MNILVQTPTFGPAEPAFRRAKHPDELFCHDIPLTLLSLFIREGWVNNMFLLLNLFPRGPDLHDSSITPLWPDLFFPSFLSPRAAPGAI